MLQKQLSVFIGALGIVVAAGFVGFQTFGHSDATERLDALVEDAVLLGDAARAWHAHQTTTETPPDPEAPWAVFNLDMLNLNAAHGAFRFVLERYDGPTLYLRGTDVDYGLEVVVTVGPDQAATISDVILAASE